MVFLVPFSLYLLIPFHFILTHIFFLSFVRREKFEEFSFFRLSKMPTPHEMNWASLPRRTHIGKHSFIFFESESVSWNVMQFRFYSSATLVNEMCKSFIHEFNLRNQRTQCSASACRLVKIQVHQALLNIETDFLLSPTRKEFLLSSKVQSHKNSNKKADLIRPKILT